MAKKTSLDTPDIYRFGGGLADGGISEKRFQGGKGSGLAEMAKLGLNVPPGFTISAKFCQSQEDQKNGPIEAFKVELLDCLKWLEQTTGKTFGTGNVPLLISVRSGAEVSMPGMMETILNVGLNDEVAETMITKTGNAWWVWDCYRRLIDMMGSVVQDIEHAKFENVLKEFKLACDVKEDSELSTIQMKEVVGYYKEVYQSETGSEFPQDPMEQLYLAIGAVFKSWDSKPARDYRKAERLENLLGTAVTIQTMVFGNISATSGTGVLFTRNPNTGEKGLFGDILFNAQGEDVVADLRPTIAIQELATISPRIYEDLLHYADLLENHFKDMQDIEFTFESIDGQEKLYILQTRTGKRQGSAAIKIATDLVDEGLIKKETAVTKRVSDDQLLQAKASRFKGPLGDHYIESIIGRGLAAVPGAAVGQVYFSPEAVEKAILEDHKAKCILVRVETSPDDVNGMHLSQGILTSHGGKSSHAAVVARGWGKTCVVGTSDISIDYTNLLFTTENGVCVKEGEWIGINGTTGQVLLGIHEVIPAERTLELERFMSWAKKFNQYAIRANVDTPEDAILARQYGAVGIGLVRAEHMFFKSDERVADICSLILFRKDKELFGKALEKIAVYQLEDYYGILKAMDGLPVNCRLFDAPLAEFKPKKPNVITMIAEFAGVSVDVVEKLSAAMHENNSMMGMRSCHFLELFPEMTKMEAKAIIGAAVKLKKEGYDPQPEIMIPLTIKAEEIVRQKALIDQVAETIFAEEGIRIEYKVGTMIETPGACIDSDKIALPADYFCFGTNDLTQLTLGISRDDNGPFISHYVAKIFAGEDPFETLDPSVKELMRLSVQKGKNTKSTLKVGICGEHGGDPRSIIFCLQELGMHYVSPSTNRVETAILVAARLSFLLPQH